MFTNGQVHDEIARLRGEIATLRAEIRTLVAPASAPVAPVASAPIVVEAAPAPAKVALLCVGHLAKSTPACAREFGKVESLAAHNAWAHKS
jgi:hypothetical protein